MICKIYPVKEGDVMPYEQIAEYGNFPWYKKVESPRQAEIDVYHKEIAEGKEYDPMTNEIIDPATGERTNLKTIVAAQQA
jgi:hypothetical protein